MTPVYRYEPSPSVDLLIARVWAQMHATDDLWRTFRNRDLTLSAVYEFSKPPGHELLYCMDDDGMWLLAWFDRFLHGALLSVWVRADMRPTLRATLAFKRILIGGCIGYGVVMGVTREELLPVHRALGYAVVGVIPGLMGGDEDGIVVHRVATPREVERWLREQRQAQPGAAQEPPQAREQPVQARVGREQRAQPGQARASATW